MKRVSLWISVLLALTLGIASFSGCGGEKETTPKGKYEILRSSQLGGAWQMYQIRVILEAGSEFDIDLLGLSGTDRVDGYFYPEKGAGASLQITAGDTLIYKADATTVALGSTVSDRFSFQASAPVGTAYVIKFHNGGTETANVFIELLYPKAGQIRGPIDIK